MGVGIAETSILRYRQSIGALDVRIDRSCSKLSVVMGAGIAAIIKFSPFSTPEGYEPAPKIHLT